MYQIQRDQTFTLRWAPITQIIKLKYLPERRVDDPSPENLPTQKRRCQELCDMVVQPADPKCEDHARLQTALEYPLK